MKPWRTQKAGPAAFLLAVGSILLETAVSAGALAATPPEPLPTAGRPLGVLISPIQGFKTNPPVAAPIRPVSTPAPPSVAIPPARPVQPLPSGTAERPLGVLFDTGQDYRRPSPVPRTSAVPAVPAAPSVLPAQPSDSRTPWQTIGGTRDRPLGTLLGPTPELPRATERPAVRGPAAEPAADGEAPSVPAVSFAADTMSFDRESGIVTATGNVEVYYEDRKLFADQVSYDRNEDIVTARGNVTLVEPGGETVFGDVVTVTGDLKDGIIENIGIILADRSRIAGADATRTAGRMTELRRATYSPCNLCEDAPEKPPMWQIKAVRVIHDKTEKIVEYRDAWLEFFGFPVAYTPYFRHPDPTVRRKSGFLFPSIGNSSDLGTTIQAPYFWAISEHEDATITPIVTTEEGPILGLEYRKKTLNGEIEMDGSVTNNSDDANAFETEKGEFGVRGHLRSKGRFDINDAWRWGFDLNRSTDETYMRRFGFGSPSSLNSRLFAEAFRTRSYFSVDAHVFQGLETGDDQSTIPFVLPLVDFNHVGERDRVGGRTKLDFNFLTLTRESGTDVRRMSLHTLWERPFVGAFGDVYRLSFGLNGDLYHVTNHTRNTGEDFDGLSYRAQPVAAVSWRMPFVKVDGPISQMIEPMGSLVWTPYGGNPDDIPNEDSSELEFDDTNLFSLNRFSGLDRVEGGPRLTYGLKWQVSGEHGGRSRAFIGQTWRPKEDDTYAEGSGLEDQFSDIVARVDVDPGEHLRVSYRTRFSSDNFSPTRNELEFSAGIPAFRVSSRYVFLDRQANSEFTGREEINLSTQSRINRFWRAGFNAVRDLAASEMRSVGLFAVYENECVIFTARGTRSFYEDQDLEPTDSITFNLVLKTIGEVHTGLSTGN